MIFCGNLRKRSIENYATFYGKSNILPTGNVLTSGVVLVLLIYLKVDEINEHRAKQV